MRPEERVRELEEALDQCLAWAERLERRIAELEASRTWRLQRAVAEAGGSLRQAVRLPGRLLGILRGDEQPLAPPPPGSPWPSDRPLLSASPPAAPGEGFSAWTLADVEILSPAPDLNALFQQARGRYLALPSPGGAVSPAWFERAVLALENDASAAVCYEGGAPFELERLQRFNPVPPGAVFRKELFDELGGFHLDAADPVHDFWLRTARAGCQGAVLGRPRRPGKPRFRGAGRFPRGLDFSARRPCLMLLLPWLAHGGAEQVALELIARLREEIAFCVVALEPGDHPRRSSFEALTPWVYCLDELGVRDVSGFLAELAAAHRIRGALVSSTGVGYQALPALAGLWRADIVHNTAPEGHLARSIVRRSEIDMHFAVGRLQRDALAAGGVEPARITLAPNGVCAAGRFNPSRWAPRRDALRDELGLEPDDFVLAYIARLSPEKGPERFVVALSMLRRMFPDRNVRALLAGDGPRRLAVGRLLRDEGLRGVVRMLGFTERIPEILAASDAFCLPSSIEGSPLTLLEAMSMGLPAVASDVGAVSELIEDGQTGLLVREPSAGAFADACARLLREPELGPRLGGAARRLVAERYELADAIHPYREAILRGLGPTS